jgi:hypothetical protein
MPQSSSDNEPCRQREASKPQRLADLGGTAYLRGREAELARTSLMPEILRLALTELSSAPSNDTIITFVVACMETPVGPGGICPADFKDAVESLAQVYLGKELAVRCQHVLIRRAEDPQEHEVVRWTCLGAAAQLAASWPSRPSLRYLLLSALIGLRGCEDHQEFARRSARVIGMAHAIWPYPESIAELERLSTIPLARDEALFELGLTKLRKAIDADTAPQADASFEEARAHFDQNRTALLHRPEAMAYAGALSMITALRRGEPPEVLGKMATDIRRELSAWITPHEPMWPWMGATLIEFIYFEELLMRLDFIADDALAAYDVNAEIYIRNVLVRAYLHNRVILQQGPDGVETYVGPTLTARLFREEMTSANLKVWLKDVASQEGDLQDLARQLLAKLWPGEASSKDDLPA